MLIENFEDFCTISQSQYSRNRSIAESSESSISPGIPPPIILPKLWSILRSKSYASPIPSGVLVYFRDRSTRRLEAFPNSRRLARYTGNHPYKPTSKQPAAEDPEERELMVLEIPFRSFCALEETSTSTVREAASRSRRWRDQPRRQLRGRRREERRWEWSVGR